MVILWQILIQFIFRLSFGVAAALAITPARQVTSGYFRIQLWVLMGLNTLASLAIFSSGRPVVGGLPAVAVGSAVLCYVGSVVWLYERWRAGKWILGLISLLGLVGALLAALRGTGPAAGPATIFCLFDVVSSGLLLGTTLAAMLLGHWYLNTPTMELAPLKRLVLVMLLAVAVRALCSATGLGAQIATELPVDTSLWIFIAFRWLSGLVGAAVMGVLAWYTLQVPNTQSATGILYAGVILVFIGELMSQLLSASLSYPV